MDYKYCVDGVVSVFTSWSTVFLLVVLIFRKQFVALLGRSTCFEGFGVKTTFNQNQSREVAIKSSLEEIKIPEYRKALELSIERIHKELSKRKDDSREQALVESLAVMQLVAGAERVYNLIFGSQIKTLIKLKDAGELSDSDAQGIYMSAKNRYPNFYNDYAYDQWVMFLQANSLVEKSEASIKITDEGRAFVAYLFENKYFLEKVF